MADIWSLEKRSQVMGKIRSKNTRPEILLRKVLFANGYRYRIHCMAMPGKPDIVFAKYKTVIFVHGCFGTFTKIAAKAACLVQIRSSGPSSFPKTSAVT